MVEREKAVKREIEKEREKVRWNSSSFFFFNPVIQEGPASGDTRYVERRRYYIVACVPTWSMVSATHTNLFQVTLCIMAVIRLLRTSHSRMSGSPSNLDQLLRTWVEYRGQTPVSIYASSRLLPLSSLSTIPPEAYVHSFRHVCAIFTICDFFQRCMRYILFAACWTIRTSPRGKLNKYDEPSPGTEQWEVRVGSTPARRSTLQCIRRIEATGTDVLFI
jgi:hypothetical protein